MTFDFTKKKNMRELLEMSYLKLSFVYMQKFQFIGMFQKCMKYSSRSRWYEKYKDFTERISQKSRHSFLRDLSPNLNIQIIQLNLLLVSMNIINPVPG